MADITHIVKASAVTCLPVQLQQLRVFFRHALVLSEATNAMFLAVKSTITLRRCQWTAFVRSSASICPYNMQLQLPIVLSQHLIVLAGVTYPYQ